MESAFLSQIPPPFVPPLQRGEGWQLCPPSPEGAEGDEHYLHPTEGRKIILKHYFKDNNPAHPVTLELRYDKDGLLGLKDAPAELHYEENGKAFKTYWYRQGVYWPHLSRQKGWQIESLPSKEGGQGLLRHISGTKAMTLTSQNNVLPSPSPFSNCELAFYRVEETGALTPHREGNAPAFLLYERLTSPDKYDWDSSWRPVWMEWKKDGLSQRASGPYLIKMGFKQTFSLFYTPHPSQHKAIEVIKTPDGHILGKRYPEVPGEIKGIAYREKNHRPEAYYFSPSPERPLLAIHFLPQGKKQFFYETYSSHENPTL